MTNHNYNQTWNEYSKDLLSVCKPIIKNIGFTLDDHQPHLLGERFLIQAVTTEHGIKLILQGTHDSGKKAIIKVASDEHGKKEIQHERQCRSLINTFQFAYGTFDAPEELAFIEQGNILISIQEYIEQSSTFLERSLNEQYGFVLNSFKAQEKAQITTAGHFTSVVKNFGIFQADTYLSHQANFVDTILKSSHAFNHLQPTLERATKELGNNKTRIEQYTGFLTHTDFVPHNFRIRDNKLFLLDFSSIRFGNKHEGWARLLNFMTLYNHDLEQSLIYYVEKNRSPEERESLQLMRIYRLTEIIMYYVKTLDKSADNLLKLNHERIEFWHEVLKAELQNTRVSRDIVQSYIASRDSLRSNEEKTRQQGLH